jgi:hypothetical protein
MKKAIILFMSIFIIITFFTSNNPIIVSSKNKSDFSSCRTSKTIRIEAKDKAKKPNHSKKFQYFYRGFATINVDREENYPIGTYIIEKDEDWHDYMDKYVPGIFYDCELDFSKYYLIVNSALSPRPTYSVEFDIKSFYSVNKRIEVEYAPIQNPIYAQNIDNLEHIFVNILRTKKENIPSEVKNIYKK